MSVKLHLGFYLAAILLPTASYGQLRLYGAPRSTTSETSTARVKSTTPIDLPFWDDFSWAELDKPDTLWVNSESVFVNAGNAVKAPSINVATFDGLNASGVPYKTSPADYLAFGFTDSLTSRPIKLASNVPNILDRDSVFLSFFYQWAGNGEAPDKQDYLQVELLNSSSQWEVVAKFNANGDLDPFIFYDTMIKIDQTGFYHDAFQFRFRSYGRQSGFYDTWNVDYVYLDKGRAYADDDFPDKATGSKIGPMFRNQYYAAHNRHFFKDPANNLRLPSFYYSNNIGGQPRPSNYSVDLQIDGWSKSGKDTTSLTGVLDTINITPEPNQFEQRLVTFDSLPAKLQKYATFDSLLRLEMKLQIDSGEVDKDLLTSFRPRIKALPYRVNNYTSQNYVLSNYYAYDDGTAEGAVGAAQSGDRIVVRYDMLTDNDPGTEDKDTVNAVQVYFSHQGFDSPSSVVFMILASRKNGEGLPDSLLYEESIGSAPQPLNTFLTFKLQQGVVVPENFFIGWKETVANKTARVGFDKSNNTGDRIYVYSNGTWYQNTDAEGSIMIRPVFGKGDIVTSVGEEQKTTISIYPNPNRGEFFIDAPVTKMSIINVTGQSIPYTSSTDNNRTYIRLLQPTNGLYIIRFRSDDNFQVGKIIVRD